MRNHLPARGRELSLATTTVVHSIEHLECRRLLSGLLEMRSDAGMIDLPSSGNFAGGRTAQVVDADRTYLARTLALNQIPNVEKLTPALQTLLSRELRNGEAVLAEVGAQKINGTRYDSLYNVANGLLHLDLWVDSLAAALPMVKTLGMEVTATFAEGIWQMIGGFISPSKLMDLSNLKGLRYAAPSEVVTPDGVAPTRDVSTGPAAGGDAQGTVTNQWEAQSRADVFKAILPAENGSGIQVGVISDSVNRVGSGIAASQATNNLPATVNNLEDAASGIDEGRAMLELIYDVADGAGLYFHSSYGVSGHAAAYNALKAAGVDVIADDIPNFSQPVFQQGAISVAAENAYVTHDVLVFGSAGNRNNEGLAGAWANNDADRYHNFSAADETLDFTIGGGGDQTFYLHWNQPWGAATTDLDIVLYNRNADGSVGSLLYDSNINNVGGNPLETLTITDPGSYHLAILVENGAASGASAAGLQLQMYLPDTDNEITYIDTYTANSPAINTNRNSDLTFVLGAVPTTNLGTIEAFSSRGPITRYFTDAGAAYATPVTREVPQFHAADGTATSVPGFGSFFGTSASAPNAAAVAALVLDVAGNVGAGDLSFSNLLSIFTQTAVGTNAGLAWNNAYGLGRIDALGAGFAAKGNTINEYAVELNQFGDGSLASGLANLFAQNDIDGVYFAFDNAGAATLTMADIDTALDPAMALYRKDVAGYSGFEAFDDDDGVGDDALISRSLSFWTTYTAELFNQTLNATSTDYSFSINGPTPVISAIALNANGDYNSTAENLGTINDTDYYDLVVPVTSNGSVVITVTPTGASPTLDPVVSLYNASGALVGRADATFSGGVETLNLTGLVPGASYNIRVGSYNYASGGDFSLDVNFQTYLPLTLSSAEGYAIFNHLGNSPDASDINVFMDSAADVDSVYFAGDTGWTGTYNASATGVVGVVPTIAIYDATSGALVAFDANAGNSLTASLSFSGTALTRYILAVASKNGGTGDVTFDLTAPGTFAGENIPLNLFADGANPNNSIAPAADSDFFNFVVPANATSGTLRLLNADPAADGVIALWNDSGSLVARSDNALPGGVDTLNTGLLVAGATYRVTILTQDYASSGGFVFQVDLNAQSGSVTGVKYHDLNADGSRAGTDPGLPGWRIYADLNNNGSLDAAATYPFEPDYFSPGLLLNTRDPRVTLSAIGSGVTSSNVYSRTNVLSSTGDQVFGYDGTFDPLWIAGSQELRIDFALPAYSLSIDAISDDASDQGTLRIYDASGVLLGTYTTAALASGQIETMSLTRSQGDIAYAIATGTAIDNVHLDNLRWSVAEPTAVTDANGAYAINAIPTGTRMIREVLQPGWLASQGASGNSANVTSGGTVTDVRFGNYQYASVSGNKYNDVNRNGVVDVPDSPLAGVRVYVDLDNDGTFDAGEPNAITNAAGAYSISNITPGAYRLREVIPANWEPVAPAAGAYNIVLSSNSAFVRDFLNRRMADFGDAPAPYATLYAANGAYHWLDTALRMGVRVDAEADGQPNVTATGDDLANLADEDGVEFLDPILPGNIVRIRVNTSAAGRINGWIDLNRDGDWNDPIDLVINNVAVAAAGTHQFNVAIPVIAGLGVSFGRFRFNAAGGIGPEGAGGEGEVEDYRVVIGDSTPPAVMASEVQYQTYQGITISFSETLNPLSIQPADLQAQNLTTPANFVPSSVVIAPTNDKVTFVFAPGVVLTDGNYNFRLAAGSVTDVAGNPLAAQYDYAGADAFFLAGDCNRDKVVSFDDLLILAQNYGQSPRNFSQGNLNYSADGLVSFDDLLILAQRYGSTLFSTQPIGTRRESLIDAILE